MTDDTAYTQLVMYNAEQNKLAVLSSFEYCWVSEYGQTTDDFGIKRKHAIGGDDFMEAVIDPAWVIVGAL